MKEQNCKIVSLSANNVMKLTAVQITPERSVITLKGAIEIVDGHVKGEE
jgi:hypothetical protein